MTTPIIDLPKGMRTWIYENAEDVAAALYCLMNDHTTFRSCVVAGMLMNYKNKQASEEEPEGFE